jgi:glycerophosphoryl diester phosphodiesterase
MMLLAHRGRWQAAEDQNTIAALEAAFRHGDGVETDLRDQSGDLVIAHDVPNGKRPSFADVLTVHRRHDQHLPLALNIKADGLRSRLKPLLLRHGVTNYFCFDMSLPETLAYRREGLRYFARESEYEPAPALYAEAAGVWMDMFDSDWITPARILEHLAAGKQVALVSPELHQRPHLSFWATLHHAGLSRERNLMLCTDHCAAAREFFHE